MAIKISELPNITTTYNQIVRNDASLEVSDLVFTAGVPEGPEELISIRTSKLGLTNRFRFTASNLLASPASDQLIASIPVQNLLETSDFGSIVAETIDNDGTLFFPAGIYTIHANCIELNASGSGEYRLGSSITEFFLGNGSLRARTRTGGVATSLDFTDRVLPDSTTYSMSGSNAIIPYISNVIYSGTNTLDFYVRFAWDDYTSTPGPSLVTGFIDVCPLPVPTYSPSSPE